MKKEKPIDQLMKDARQDATEVLKRSIVPSSFRDSATSVDDVVPDPSITPEFLEECLKKAEDVVNTPDGDAAKSVVKALIDAIDQSKEFKINVASILAYCVQHGGTLEQAMNITYGNILYVGMWVERMRRERG